MVLADVLFNYKKSFKKLEIAEPEIENLLKETKDIPKVNIGKEIGVIPFTAIVEDGSAENKKKFISFLNISDTEKKVDILNELLEDEDIDVVHYAAVKLNSVDKEFNFKLKKATQNKNQVELTKLYMEYCKSGLLEEEVLEAYRKKVNLYLKNNENFNKIDNIAILEYYKKMRDKENFYSFMDKIIETKIYSKNILTLGIHFAYEEKDIEKMLYFEKLV